MIAPDLSPDPGSAAARFPGHLAHAGVWTGTYRHVGADGALIERLSSRVTCEFPPGGTAFYRQGVELTGANGRTTTARFDGFDRGDHVAYDTPTFSGRSWEAGGGVLLLDLTRKDEPGAHFVEIIVLAPGGRTRARTWHWFKDGALYRRTLCDETRIA